MTTLKIAFYSMAGILIAGGIYLIVLTKSLWGTVNSVASDMSVGLSTSIGLFAIAGVLIVITIKASKKANKKVSKENY